MVVLAARARCDCRQVALIVGVHPSAHLRSEMAEGALAVVALNVIPLDQAQQFVHQIGAAAELRPRLIADDGLGGHQGRCARPVAAFVEVDLVGRLAVLRLVLDSAGGSVFVEEDAEREIVDASPARTHEGEVELAVGVGDQTRRFAGVVGQPLDREY